MLTRDDITAVLNSYDLSNLTVAALGGHSALDVCAGAKKYGFRTLVVAQKGREKTYAQHYKTRENGKGCVDEVILVNKFGDVVEQEIQNQLTAGNTIFVHNRYFWVYCNYERIENEFKVPIFGTRHLVRLEERDQPKNQYYLLEKAGIRMPKIFEKPADIDRLAIVKVSEAARGYERAFFICDDQTTFNQKSAEMLAKGKITQKALAQAVIEEYILGAQVNFNYFYSPLSGELELMGTDMRRQTNLDGFLRLDAETQNDLLAQEIRPSMIETGHVAVTIKESLVEKAYDIGEKFVETLKKETPPGIIGPFALQGAVTAEEGREELVIFDVSMRIPGSPGTRFTPYSGYLYGESVSYGERIAIELKQATEKSRLAEILT